MPCRSLAGTGGKIMQAATEAEWMKSELFNTYSSKENKLVHMKWHLKQIHSELGQSFPPKNLKNNKWT